MEFLFALQRSIRPGVRRPASNLFRGAPLVIYDGQTREAMDAVRGQIDVRAATEVWEAGLASRCRSEPVWVHGDVTPSNLLVGTGRLGAVIDFGCCAVGDSACDLTIAWTFFTAQSRAAFRHAVATDDGKWARSGGWVLWKGLITLVTACGSRRSAACPRNGLGGAAPPYKL